MYKRIDDSKDEFPGFNTCVDSLRGRKMLYFVPQLPEFLIKPDVGKLNTGSRPQPLWQVKILDGSAQLKKMLKFKSWAIGLSISRHLLEN